MVSRANRQIVSDGLRKNSKAPEPPALLIENVFILRLSNVTIKIQYMKVWPNNILHIPQYSMQAR